MSVINQMLKDLEQRNAEQGHNTAQIAIPSKSSPLKIIMLIIAVLVLINIAGFYIWQLVSENQLLKNQVAKPLTVMSEIQATTLKSLPVLPVISEAEKSVEQTAGKSIEKSAESIVVEKQVEEVEPVEKIVAISKTKENLITTKPIPKAIAAETIIVAKKTPKPVEEVVVEQENSPASLSISRRQLSPAELIEKKLVRAENAILRNKVEKAEALYEEILIINPNHKQARKKLAALWFGRQSYQSALNLLSQGISLAPKDSELRTMKARIYLKQGNLMAAYKVLKPLAAFEQQEYQVLLANVAQQIKQYQSAINAYQLLIKMQPYSGRWHLGLAIVYDKNSQFLLAVEEYTLALAKDDLSVSSAQFAHQRVQALGE
ncbi:MAG: tetratricopeptide repeat protein [Colwellia sp.]